MRTVFYEKGIAKKNTSPVHGTIAPPSSKSLSNRALIISALTDGESRITGLLDSDDTRHMRECLKNIGVSFGAIGESLVVSGGAGD